MTNKKQKTVFDKHTLFFLIAIGNYEMLIRDKLIRDFFDTAILSPVSIASSIKLLLYDPDVEGGEDVSRETLCRILRDTGGGPLVIEMTWALFSIMFR